MTNFSTYTFNKDKEISVCQFFPTLALPKDLPISTPFTFPSLGDRVLLALDKNNWWNPLGGYMEEKESWQDTPVNRKKRLVRI